MDRLAEKKVEDGVKSIFIYTHEAHPGEIVPHLTSMDQKHRHADALIETYGVRRPIYLDSLDGACHRAYGSMPNMTWIFDRRGRVVYKADWTDIDSVSGAIDALLALPSRRRSGQRVTPFRAERLEYRDNDRADFYRGLERNGEKAVEEFRAAFG